MSDLRIVPGAYETKARMEEHVEEELSTWVHTDATAQVSHNSSSSSSSSTSTSTSTSSQ